MHNYGIIGGKFFCQTPIWVTTKIIEKIGGEMMYVVFALDSVVTVASREHNQRCGNFLKGGQ